MKFSIMSDIDSCPLTVERHAIGHLQFERVDVTRVEALPQVTATI